jgi:hypothetical protein
MRSLVQGCFTNVFDLIELRPCIAITDLSCSMRVTWTVFRQIYDFTYNEVVSPLVNELTYRGKGSKTIGTSLTYGELCPRFIEDIANSCRATASTFLVDLGSGIGSACITFSLLTGGSSFGIELRPKLCKLSREFTKKVKNRSKAWGFICGNAETVEGNFLTHPSVPESLSKADIILMANKVFAPEGMW